MSALAKSQKTKAEVLVAQADKSLTKKSWFAASKAAAQEEGAEILLQAANAYKVGGWMQEAGNTYTRAAQVYESLSDGKAEAAKAWSQAATSYKKNSPADAASSYQSAIGILTDLGRLTQAAKLSKEVADLYENLADELDGTTDTSPVVLAMESYEQAADLYKLENANGQASSCLAKLAELCSAALDPPDLPRAAGLYQDLGLQCLESNLLKFNAKSHFLHAILCHLAGSDLIAAEQAMQRYETADYTFMDSREGKFAQQLVTNVQDYDAEGLATACMEYDRISKLDPWKTTMLVRVKRGIAGGGVDGLGGGDDEDDEDDFDLT